MQEFAEGVDEGAKSLFQICIGIDTDSWTPIARERLRLPLKNKGRGLQDAVNGRHGHFVGDMLQSIMPLMNRTDKNNCAIEGRPYIPTITNLLGGGLFDYPLKSPWESLLNKSSLSSDLANGLQHAWSHLITFFPGGRNPRAARRRDTPPHTGHHPHHTC